MHSIEHWCIEFKRLSMQEYFHKSCYQNVQNDSTSLQKQFLWQDFVPSMRDIIFLKSLLNSAWKPLTPLRNLLTKFKRPALDFQVSVKSIKGEWRKRRWFQPSEHSFYKKGQGRAYWGRTRPWWWCSHCRHSPATSSSYLLSFIILFNILWTYYINNTSLGISYIFLL